MLHSSNSFEQQSNQDSLHPHQCTVVCKDVNNIVQGGGRNARGDLDIISLSNLWLALDRDRATKCNIWFKTYGPFPLRGTLRICY